MTRIQQVHWELDMDYIGHPYYVTGNAILHAIGQHLPDETHRHLNASHGFAVPGQFGTFPESHSQSGTRPYLGSGLPTVESYADLFLFRRPSNPWLLDSRPRDALNTHDLRIQSGHPALAHETIMGRPESSANQQHTTKWYISAYLHATEENILPLEDHILDGLQFGGKRNYGYGTTHLKDSQTINLDNLEYPHIEDADAYYLQLITPFVLESDYPNTNDVDIPWWWSATKNDLRERDEKIVEQRDQHELRTIDHGQIVQYAGDKPINTAINGICRVGTHSKYGFGELRVIPAQKTQLEPSN